MKLNHYWWKEAKYALKMAWKCRDQRTLCYCPVCGLDLNSTDSFVSDTGEGFKNKVRYKCVRCKTKSRWNFDIAPAPILKDWKLSRKSMKQKDNQ